MKPMVIITHRASSCPRIIECPGSTGGEIHINESNEVATVGTCIHEMIHEMIDKGAPTMPNPERFLEKYDLEAQADDIRFLSLRAHRLWHGHEDDVALKKYFPHPVTEVKRSFTETIKAHWAAVTLSGHMDLSTYCDPPNDDHAIIADWKAGYKSETHRYVDQMKAYAFLQAAKSKKVQRVTAIIGWLRDGMLDVMEFSRDELRAWAKKFFTQDIWWDEKTYSPGWACDYCPRKHSCPGLGEMVQGGVDMFAPGGEGRGMMIALGDGRTLPAEQFHKAVTLAKYVRGAVEKFLASAKYACAEHGPFPVEGGQQYHVKEKKGRTSINVDLGWPVLTQHLTQDQLGAIVKVGKGDTEKALRATVKKGKQKHVVAVFEQLKELGAITVAKSSQTMELIDTPKEQPDGEEG